MLISFNLFFYSLIFIINIDYYKQIFRIIIIVIASIWLFELITWAYFDLIPISTQYGTLGELMIFLSFSVIGQGLVIYIIYYIKKHTAKFNESKVFGIYHIHEGFIGIIFIIIALFLLRIRSSLLFLTDIWWKRMSIILWTIQIFLFIFLYIGSFLIFRDWHDVRKFRFITTKKKKDFLNDNSKNHHTSVFNYITQDDLPFFKFPRLLYYPFGIIFTIFALNAIIYGINFLPKEIFNLENETVILLGYFAGFLAGGFIGRDWFRLFRILFPQLYEEINIVINTLKKT